MEGITEGVININISDSSSNLNKKNRIQVSNTKKPLFFYVNLAKVLLSYSISIIIYLFFFFFFLCFFLFLFVFTVCGRWENKRREKKMNRKCHGATLWANNYYFGHLVIKKNGDVVCKYIQFVWYKVSGFSILPKIVLKFTEPSVYWRGWNEEKKS